MATRSQRRVAYRRLNQYVPLSPNQPAPWPELTGLDPNSAAVGDPDVTLHCYGSSFAEGAVVVFDGGDVPTTFVSEGEVTAVISPSTATEGSVTVCVRNLDDRETEDWPFTFTAAALPDPPVLDSITPSVMGMTNAFNVSMYLYGTGYVYDGTLWADIGGVRYDPLPASSVGIICLSLAPSDPLFSQPAIHDVHVVDSGVFSAPQTLEIRQTPLAASIEPISVPVGSPDTVFTMRGDHFTADGVIKLNGSARATTIVDAQTATAVLLAADFVNPFTSKSIFILCNGVMSNNLFIGALAGTEPAPALNSYSPNPVPVGHTGNVTVQGALIEGACEISMDGELLLPTTDYMSMTSSMFLKCTRFWEAAGTHELTMHHTVLQQDAVPLTIQVGATAAVPILDHLYPTSSRLNPLQDLTLQCYCDASLTYHADMWVMIDDKRYEYWSWSQQYLQVIVPKADLAVSGIRQVRVVDAAGESLPLPFTVEAAPAFTLSSYSPNPIPAGLATGVTVIGAGFDATTEFYIDGAPFDPSSVVINTSTRATITAPSEWVEGNYVLSAYSDSLGQNSNQLPLTVVAAPALPTVTALTPSSVTTGSSDTSIVIDGTGFDASAVVMLNGETPLVPTAIGATQLTFTLPANWMINPATFQMSVITAAGTSNALPLTVAAAAADPTITSISPTTFPAGSPDSQLTVYGTNFDATCVVTIVDTPMVSVFVDSTTMQATVPAMYLQYEGSTAAIKVTKPGSTASNAVELVVGQAGTWATVYDETADFVASGAPDPGWQGYTLAATIPLAGFSQTGGSKIRLTLNGGQSSAKASAIWVGNGGANPVYGFTGDQVQLTAAGATTIIAPGGGSLVTDAVDFVKDAVNTLVISWQFTDEAALTDAKAIAMGSVPPGSAFYFAAGALAGVPNKTGFNPENSQWRLVSKVELFIPAVAKKKAAKKTGRRKR